MGEFRFFAIGDPGEGGVDMTQYIGYLIEFQNYLVGGSTIRMSEGPGARVTITGEEFRTEVTGGTATVAGGTIEGMTAVAQGNFIFRATDLNLGAERFFELRDIATLPDFIGFVLNGSDRIFGSDRADDLEGGAGRDVIFAKAGNDTLSGDAGADRLEGGAGRDNLYGGAGDDRLFGGEGRDFLIGLAGDDLVRGGKGADTLTGHTGRDTLTGDDGADQFLFFPAPVAGQADRITDFRPGTDEIALESASFPAAGPTGPLAASAFRRGAAAADADDRIIYNPRNGNLIYDADGNGAGAGIVFARLDEGLNVRAGDFILVLVE